MVLIKSMNYSGLESRRKNFHWSDKRKMNLENFNKYTAGEFIILAEEDDKIIGFSSLDWPYNFMKKMVGKKLSKKATRMKN